MYEYIPKPDRRPALALVLLLFAAAVCCFIPVRGAPCAPLRVIGTLSAFAAIMLIPRFLLQNFAYAVEYTEGGASAGADLTVSVLCGGKKQTVCRVSAAGGRLERYGSDAKARCRAAGMTVINYCPDLFPTVSYIFIPAEAQRAAADPSASGRGELAAVRFRPDPRLVQILEAVKDPGELYGTDTLF